MGFKVGLLTGVFLFGAGELPPAGDYGPWMQGSALVILGVMMAKLFAELSAQRKAHIKTIDTLCERWDGWEKTRHDDHDSLARALTMMRENCASVNQQRTTSEIPKSSLPKG